MLRKTLFELVLVIAFGLVIGLIMAIAANLFVEGVIKAADLRAEWANFSFLGQTYSYSSVVFLLAAASLVVGLKHLLKLPGWAGPADTIYAAHSSAQNLDVKRGMASTVAAFITACGGGSVGQYGPLVHFGASIGVLFRRFLDNRFAQDIFIGCGVAASISAGFNAPLAGVIFAHEAILRHFSLRAIAPIFVASISADTFDQLLFPSADTTFQLTQSVPELISIVPVFIFLGPLLSLVAILFMRSLRLSAKFAANYPYSKNHLPFIAAFVCGSVGIFIPEILGIGVGTVNELIAGNFTLGMVVVLLIAKLTMTALCIGFGLFGGVFSPALFIGVAAGSLAATLLQFVGITEIDQVLMVSSMAAVSASVIGAPISTVIIVLELTGSYEYAVAAMIAVIISSLVTHRLFGLSFFDRQLLDRGIDMTQGREAILLNQTPVRDCTLSDYVWLSETTTGQEAFSTMSEAKLMEAYAFNEAGDFSGKLDLFGAQAAGTEPILTQLDRQPIALIETDSLQTAMGVASDFVGEGIPILNESRQRLVGVVTEGDLFHAVLGAQTSVRKIERA
ncbi:MAG: chloride channel protein [Porticoccaceae bacterium]|jgi:chloride channel protein, CIC family|nr:chloride channel protein [Porticoccaceae bacterium]MDP4940886.1 chloride channel protein [OM182 bacterium]